MLKSSSLQQRWSEFHGLQSKTTYYKYSTKQKETQSVGFLLISTVELLFKQTKGRLLIFFLAIFFRKCSTSSLVPKRHSDIFKNLFPPT
jgi:hypothetical protein